VFKTIRKLPWFRVVAVAQTALLAREHLRALSPDERHRMLDLVRRVNRLSPAERDELRRLVMTLEPRAFAARTASRFSMIPLPRWLLAGRSAR
jgi:hypothetical protein